MSNGGPKTFEEKLDRIDAIVKELEGGNVELDRSVALFKEGKTLAAECQKMLGDMQEQVDRAMSADKSPESAQ
ncbi:MAG: exodeoxyribonuclease VII small subunit [Vulcanimicrobiaceae bacterium]